MMCWMSVNFNHFRINHSTHFADRRNHINGIENFWNQIKRHLRKFNGIPKVHFELYVKECEWRFNNSEIKSQLSILKQLVRDNVAWLSRTAPFVLHFFRIITPTRHIIRKKKRFFVELNERKHHAAY